MNYESTVLPFADGLPKLKDFPAEHGGSGTVMSEAPVRPLRAAS